MERYGTTATEGGTERDSDSIVKVAYGHFIREPLRTFARDEVQRRNGLEVKDALIPIGDAVLGRIQAYAADSPSVVSSVVVGNVQYPAEVADAVSRKLAATQELQRKDMEIEIERKERTKREVQAQGIANAMQIIQDTRVTRCSDGCGESSRRSFQTAWHESSHPPMCFNPFVSRRRRWTSVARTGAA